MSALCELSGLRVPTIDRTRCNPSGRLESSNSRANVPTCQIPNVLPGRNMISNQTVRASDRQSDGVRGAESDLSVRTCEAKRLKLTICHIYGLSYINKCEEITGDTQIGTIIAAFKKKAGRFLRAFPIQFQRVVPARGDSTWLFDGACNYV